MRDVNGPHWQIRLAIGCHYCLLRCHGIYPCHHGCRPAPFQVPQAHADIDCRYGVHLPSIFYRNRGNRSQLIIATKGGHPDMETNVPRLTREELEIDVNGSLEKLQTDIIDLYYFHRDDTECVTRVGDGQQVSSEMKSWRF